LQQDDSSPFGSVQQQRPAAWKLSEFVAFGEFLLKMLLNDLNHRIALQQLFDSEASVILYMLLGPASNPQNSTNLISL
jgi:hypothetical protein